MMRWIFIVAMVSAVLGSVPSQPACAHWLSELAEMAAKSGSKAGRVASEAGGELGHAASALTRLPAELKATALAAEALPDGAWRFVNAADETITATTAADIRTVMNVLAPSLAKDASVTPTLLIGSDTLFGGRDAIKALPDSFALRLAQGDTAIPLIRKTANGELKIYAEIRSGLVVEATDRFHFEEALWRLGRPLSRARVRVLSLDGAATGRLPVAAPKTAGQLVPSPETVAAFDLRRGLANLSGQTVVVTGRVDGKMLRFLDARGVEQSIVLDDVFAAAESNGVDLILLGSDTARQPGVRTWLMQETAVANLDAAMASATMGDLYASFGRGQGRLVLSVQEGRGGYVRLSARPAEAELPPRSGAVDEADTGTALLDATLNLLTSPLGNIQAVQIEATAPKRELQEERDGRLIWFLPVWLQNLLLLSLVSGLLGWSTLSAWSKQIWARGRAGAARNWRGWLLETISFWLVLMPVLGIPALAWALLAAPLQFIRAVDRAVNNFFRRLTGRPQRSDQALIDRHK
jgi:hypothetical protein